MRRGLFKSWNVEWEKEDVTLGQQLYPPSPGCPADSEHTHLGAHTNATKRPAGSYDTSYKGSN